MSRLQAKSFNRRRASQHHHQSHGKAAASRWPARLADGFRRVLVGLFSFPPRPPKVTFSSSSSGGGGGGGDAAPKRSSWSGGSSNNLHPLNAHYDEAIADCVEFFNKSARVDLRSRPPH